MYVCVKMRSSLYDDVFKIPIDRLTQIVAANCEIKFIFKMQ